MPELLPLYREHVRDNDELLSYPFMGDVTQFVIEECDRAAKGQPQADLLIGRFLTVLEDELMAQDEETAALIALGFGENLCGETAAISVLQPRLGPLLTAKVRPFL